MRPVLTVLSAFLAASLAPLGLLADEILNVGDPAPPLAVSNWVKGDKVDQWDSKTTYVVEFWATWCGPCRVSIPHLTELAHEYKDKGVKFIGVDVWERDTSKVKPFVEEMGDKMDYAVVLDKVAENGDASDGAMATTWLKAAEENGIPTAFVVRDGKILWIGHPMELDKPLAKIVAGNWDTTALAKERLAEKTKERKVTKVRAKIFPLYRANDYKGVVAALDEATASDPEIAEEFAGLKFAALCNGGDIERGLELGNKLLETHKDNPMALNNDFWNVIDPKLKNDPDPRVARLALQAARRAVELTKEENVANLDTLAEALFRTGDVKGAIATEEKVLKLVEDKVKDKSSPIYQQFNDRLERYRKAVSEKKSETP